MPSRYNEFYAGLKEDLRFCVKHNRYYLVQYGCQLCQLPVAFNKVSIVLKVCPSCKQKSLVWDDTLCLFECLNLECKKLITISELFGRTE